MSNHEIPVMPVCVGAEQSATRLPGGVIAAQLRGGRGHLYDINVDVEACMPGTLNASQAIHRIMYEGDLTAAVNVRLNGEGYDPESVRITQIEVVGESVLYPNDSNPSIQMTFRLGNMTMPSSLSGLSYAVADAVSLRLTAAVYGVNPERCTSQPVTARQLTYRPRFRRASRRVIK